MPLLAVPSVITFTWTAPMACAGIDEMPSVLPLAVKQPTARQPPGHGLSVVPVAVWISAAVPIWIAVAADDVRAGHDDRCAAPGRGSA